MQHAAVAAVAAVVTVAAECALTVLGRKHVFAHEAQRRRRVGGAHQEVGGADGVDDRQAVGGELVQVEVDLRRQRRLVASNVAP